MKIGVTATGDNLDSTVDPRFGRCVYFIIAIVEGNEIKETKAIKNKGALEAHGAGIMSAQQVANLGVEKMITGNLGPNAFLSLKQMGIETYTGSGTVKDLIFLCIEGKLQKIESAVPDHFGMGGRRGRGFRGG